jgi:peroxiredoxin
MKKLFVLIMFAFLLTDTSFATPVNPGAPVVKPTVILKTRDNFFDYIGTHFFILTRDITAYDLASKVISKRAFFEKLSTGNYLPLRLSSTDGKLYYKLYKIGSKVPKEMGSYIQSYSATFLEHFNREGKPFPNFNFVDIKGNKYTTASTKGKTVVLKCWFIGCHRCEEEMPELNNLMAQYKNRKDIIFLSLAIDSKPKLEAFLKRKRFDYPIVANQEKFMSKKMQVDAYPTHFIINKNGVIISVVDNPDEIEYALKNKI